MRCEGAAIRKSGRKERNGRERASRSVRVQAPCGHPLPPPPVSAPAHPSSKCTRHTFPPIPPADHSRLQIPPEDAATMIKLRSVSPAHAGFSFGGPVRGYAGMVNVPALLQMRKMGCAGSSLPPHPPPCSNTTHTHSHRPTHPQRPHQQEEDTRRITRGRIMARNE